MRMVDVKNPTDLDARGSAQPPAPQQGHQQRQQQLHGRVRASAADGRSRFRFPSRASASPSHTQRGLTASAQVPELELCRCPLGSRRCACFTPPPLPRDWEETGVGVRACARADC